MLSIKTRVPRFRARREHVGLVGSVVSRHCDGEKRIGDSLRARNLDIIVLQNKDGSGAIGGFPRRELGKLLFAG